MVKPTLAPSFSFRGQGPALAVLKQVWNLCLSIVEGYRVMWCVVISKMGYLTESEENC